MNGGKVTILKRNRHMYDISIREKKIKFEGFD